MKYKKPALLVIFFAIIVCVGVAVCFWIHPKQNNYMLRIVVPAGSQEEIVYSDEEISISNNESPNEPLVESELSKEMVELLGNWILDVTYTEKCNNDFSIREMFGTALGDYGASLCLNDNKTMEYSIGAFTGKGTWYPDGDTGRYIAEVVVSPDERDEMLTFYEFRESLDSENYLVFEYEGYSLYWIRSLLVQ